MRSIVAVLSLAELLTWRLISPFTTPMSPSWGWSSPCEFGWCATSILKETVRLVGVEFRLAQVSDFAACQASIALVPHFGSIIRSIPWRHHLRSFPLPWALHSPLLRERRAIYPKIPWNQSLARIFLIRSYYFARKIPTGKTGPMAIFSFLFPTLWYTLYVTQAQWS